MKAFLNKHRLKIGLASLILTASHGLYAQDYGIQYLGDSGDPVTSSAGVVPISVWNSINNVTYTPGSSTTINSSVVGTTATLTLTQNPYSGNDTSGVGNGGNSSLMDGYLQNGWIAGGPAESTSVISGLPSGQLYDVYIYCFASQASPQGSYQWLDSYSVNGTGYFVATLGSTETSTFYSSGPALPAQDFTSFVPAVTFGANSPNIVPSSTDFGNYFEVTDVAAIGGDITIVSDFDGASTLAPLNGIELVPVSAPEPSAFAFVGFVGLLFAIRRQLGRV